MSVLGKKWIIKNSDKSKNILDKILENRGLLKNKKITTLHDPFLFRDMKKAVKRVNKAIKNEERIIIFGDYDVDGITGTAILFNLLKKLNAKVSYRLPHRVNDGYGLSEKFIDEFIKKEVKLLVTVDCGISCNRTIKKAHESNIDVIITDHHSIPENIPKNALAILHPKEKNSGYPFKELTGAGVALKFAEALIKENKYDPKEINCFIDLAALGTVADLGPLKDENWLIVKKGLENLTKTKWLGLKKIMQFASIKENEVLDSSAISFRIAPRINAAGRISDPYLALSLLLQEDEEKATSLGSKLEELNTLRQSMTADIFKEVEELLSKTPTLPYVLIAENSSWHIGVLGLIAGKLVEKYARPAIIMQDFGDILVASARSPEYFNIIEAITNFNKYLINFGGHAQAAGFNLKKENLPIFKEKFEKYTEEKLKNIELKPTLEIDCEIENNEINFNLLETLETLKPFGVENKRPAFLLQNITPQLISNVGKEKEHLKFTVIINNKELNVIAFHFGKFTENLRKHKSIDLVFHLDKNHWNNKDFLQLQALDFRESKQ